MNAVCMLCLVCNAFCFCVDLWCGISFSAYKNTFRDVCLRRCPKKKKKKNQSFGLDLGFRNSFCRKIWNAGSSSPHPSQRGRNNAEPLWNKKYLELIEQQTKQMDFCKRNWMRQVFSVPKRTKPQKTTKNTKTRKFDDISGTPPGHLRDISGTSLGHLRDISGTSPGQLRDNSGTSPGHLRDKLKILWNFTPRRRCTWIFAQIWARNQNIGMLFLMLVFLCFSVGAFDPPQKMAPEIFIGFISRMKWKTRS